MSSGGALGGVDLASDRALEAISLQGSAFGVKVSVDTVVVGVVPLLVLLACSEACQNVK